MKTFNTTKQAVKQEAMGYDEDIMAMKQKRLEADQKTYQQMEEERVAGEKEEVAKLNKTAAKTSAVAGGAKFLQKHGGLPSSSAGKGTLAASLSKAPKGAAGQAVRKVAGGTMQGVGKAQMAYGQVMAKAGTGVLKAGVGTMEAGAGVMTKASATLANTSVKAATGLAGKVGAVGTKVGAAVSKGAGAVVKGVGAAAKGIGTTLQGIGINSVATGATTTLSGAGVSAAAATTTTAATAAGTTAATGATVASTTATSTAAGSVVPGIGNVIGAVVGICIGAGILCASLAKAKSGDNKGAVKAGLKPIKNKQVKNASKITKELDAQYADATLADVSKRAARREEVEFNLENATMTEKERKWAVKAAMKDAKGKTEKGDKYREKIQKSQSADIQDKGDFPSAPQGEMMA